MVSAMRVRERARAPRTQNALPIARASMKIGFAWWDFTSGPSKLDMQFG